MNYNRSIPYARPCTPPKAPMMPNPEGRPFHAKDSRPLAMAYVPWQEYKDLYDPETAWKRGTLFQELDLAFAGKRG